MFDGSLNVEVALLLPRAFLGRGKSFWILCHLVEKGIGGRHTCQNQVWIRDILANKLDQFLMLVFFVTLENWQHFLFVLSLVKNDTGSHRPFRQSILLLYIPQGWLGSWRAVALPESDWWGSEGKAATLNCYCSCEMSDWPWNQRHAKMGVKPSWERWGSLNLLNKSPPLSPVKGKKSNVSEREGKEH